MLVYRDSSVAERATALADAAESLAAAVESQPGYDAAVELLITAGELESAVLDTMEHDVDEDIASGLRDLSLTAARILAAVDASGRSRATSLCRGMRAMLRVVRRELADALVRRRVPEGFAYYALYPEAYAAATRAYLAERQPRRATVIGIRSIGSSLSAVVACELARRAPDLDVVTFTVRPHGHPFDRVTAFSPAAERRIRSRVDGDFIVVDEGPGLSGSTFASVADALGALGIADERISFMPSWRADPAQLRSARSRARWPRHRCYVSSFDAVWDDGRRIAAQWNAHLVADWSGGSWREQYPAGERPVANPQHEQRKYLARRDSELLVLKFVGLGQYGRRRAQLADALAEAGHAPATHGFRRGFLATSFVAGAPLTRDALDAGVLARLGEYVAFRRSLAVARRGASCSDLLEMIDVNVADELEHFPIARETVSRLADRMHGERAVAQDGRMLPHEWIIAPTGLVKIDGVAHHDDHFLPGPQPAIWDIAGVRAELELSPDETRAVLDAFVHRAHESDVAQRLPFYDVAYLALRIGYARLSAESCVDTADGARWSEAESRYRQRLRQVLGAIERAEAACPA
ncbi:MAG TPA: hypothetical protein VHB25_15020 [Gemmatimonadaceae bacterium]|nr:hypothetical protein [Gemmatimonadaceae bacterium]